LFHILACLCDHVIDAATFIEGGDDGDNLQVCEVELEGREGFCA
jgi:hypothetical protein